MTVLTAYCPSYIPWLGLLHRIAQADLFVLTDTDRLNRKDFHTRNTIIGPNGPITLTVPVLGGRDQQLCDVQIDNTKHWRTKHWRSIEHAYQDAPHFDAGFARLYKGDGSKLAEFAEDSMRLIADAYGLTGRIGLRTSDRNIEGSGSEFILNLCQHFQADTYLCGAAGRNYLDMEAFKKAGIEVVVQEWLGAPVSALHDLFTKGPVL